MPMNPARHVNTVLPLPRLKDRVRSLTLQVEEGKKEARWMKERNLELERVVEALRKTIMRQADLSSQRVDQQGEAL